MLLSCSKLSPVHMRTCRRMMLGSCQQGNNLHKVQTVREIRSGRIRWLMTARFLALVVSDALQALPKLNRDINDG
jgi:hypothetical protein